jgi:phosphoglycerol transferase
VNGARWAASISALISIVFLGTIGDGLRQLGNPIGTGDMLATYAARTIPWGKHVGGYPFGVHLFEHYQTLDIIPETLADTVTRITGNPFLGINLMWLASFPVCAYLSCRIFREASASPTAAIVLALAYSFIPYHWLRGFEHPYLATMWSAVLGTGLALLIGTGRIDSIWQGSPTGRRRRRALLVLSSLVVAWSGVYYAFFSIVLIATALCWLWIRGADRPLLVRSSIPLCLILLAVAGVLSVAGIMGRGDPTSEPIAVRNPLQSVTYAGSASFLLVPSPLSRLPVADAVGRSLEPYVTPEIEGLGYGQFGTAVTTLAATVYLAGGVLLARRRSLAPTQRTVGVKSGDGVHGLVGLLLGVSFIFFVPWSANFLFAIGVSPGIRSWDRLLPILLLLVLVGALAVVRDLHLPWTGRGPLLISLALFAFILLDEIAPYPSLVRAATRSGAEWRADGEQYAAAINAAIPADCGILQLPYVPFPEKGVPIGNMNDYQHFLVTLTNPDKKWSYGGVKFTRSSAWAAHMPRLMTQRDLRALAEGGFCGVHVDLTGYDLGASAPAVIRLRSLLGEPSVTGRRGEWQFYRLPIAGTVHNVHDRRSLSREARSLFYPRE